MTANSLFVKHFLVKLNAVILVLIYFTMYKYKNKLC